MMSRAYDILGKVGDEQAFRQEIRDWLADHMPKDWRAKWQGVRGSALKTEIMQWLTERRKVGLGTPHWPKEWGGPGLPFSYQIIVYEELSRADAPEVEMFVISLFHTPATLFEHGTPEQKDKYLSGIINGTDIWCQGFSEPGAGSDLASLRTSARLEGDHYVVNGTKQFISGGGVSDIYVTMVRTGEAGPKGVSCLVIEKDMPGLSFGAQERKLGWNASPTAQVIFDNVKVPVANRVGAEGDGFRFAMMGLDGGRINIGAASLGGAQRCLDEAIAYTKDRQQFGKPIADFQNTQFMLADMATDLEAARALLYMAAAKVTANAPDKSRFSAMAKRLATDTGSKVANDALQLFGGYGYLQDYPIERFWRDLRVHSILEGTNQVMRMIIGRELTRQ
jgi:acyl-CoA dehydrogenase